MTELARWKTIATIAIAFSAGNLFATACGDEGGLVQNASANTAQLEAQVAELQAQVAELQDKVESIRCVLGLLGDFDFSLQRAFSDNFTAANGECGI